MKNYTLIYGEDQEFGNMGFRIAGGPNQSNKYKYVCQRALNKLGKINE